MAARDVTMSRTAAMTAPRRAARPRSPVERALVVPEVVEKELRSRGLDDVAASLPQGAAGPQGQDPDDEQDAQHGGTHGLLPAPADTDGGQAGQGQAG